MPKTKIKKIGVLCSGGDSPGMNNAVRAVVRTAIGEGIEVTGILRGYRGLIEGRFQNMDVKSVGNILHTGGTILYTSRSEKFMTEEGRKTAYDNLVSEGIEALVVVGGNGSFKGAMTFHNEFGIPVIGIPGTIDNDISGTEYTLGFDTAVQTSIDAVDKIRDTASSHERTFLVEVMGRRSPAIAVHVGVSCGAENIVFPEDDLKKIKIEEDIKKGLERGKDSSIIIVCERDKPGFGYEVQDYLEKNHDLESHVCVLGHIQRGGRPSHLDRFIGARMGFMAVKSLLETTAPMATAFINGHVEMIDMNKCVHNKIDYEKPYLELVKVLSI